jgi:hypothetical protein
MGLIVATLKRAIITQGAAAVLEEIRGEGWPPHLKPMPVYAENGKPTGELMVHLIAEAYDELMRGVAKGQFPSLSAAIIATYLEGPDHEAGEKK